MGSRLTDPRRRSLGDVWRLNGLKISLEIKIWQLGTNGPVAQTKEFVEADIQNLESLTLAGGRLSLQFSTCVCHCINVHTERLEHLDRELSGSCPWYRRQAAAVHVDPGRLGESAAPGPTR